MGFGALVACSDDAADAPTPTPTPTPEAGLPDTYKAPVDAATADVVTPAPLKPYAAWAVTPQDYNKPGPGGVPPALSFTNKTLRHTMQVSLGGEQIRVRFSNVFGTAPLVVDGAYAALAKMGSEIDAATGKALTVGGKANFTIAVGAEAWSDPVAMTVAANSKVSVGVFVANSTPVSTTHRFGNQTTYIGEGNVLSAATIANLGDGAPPATAASYYWVTGIDVYTREPANVLVLLGDSITDGVGSTPDANHRYGNYLSTLLAADTTKKQVSVINEGLAGNRILSDGAGDSAIKRFDRDVAGQTGVTNAFILLGINDIGFCVLAPPTCKTSAEITGGITTLIGKAKAKGIKVQVATLMPFKGATVFGAPYYDAAAETKRGEVNTFIKALTTTDGIVDLATVMKDPADELLLKTTFDIGDHLHPNDMGYSTLAGAFDLTRLR